MVYFMKFPVWNVSCTVDFCTFHKKVLFSITTIQRKLNGNFTVKGDVTKNTSWVYNAKFKSKICIFVLI